MHIKLSTLEQLLKIRKLFEDNLKRELGIIFQELSYAEKILNGMEENYKKVMLELSNKQKETLDALSFNNYYNYFLAIQVIIEGQKKQILEIRKRYEAKREELLIASKDKKVVEKLKERQVLMQRKEEERKEQIFLDEVSNNRRR